MRLRPRQGSGQIGSRKSQPHRPGSGRRGTLHLCSRAALPPSASARGRGLAAELSRCSEAASSSGQGIDAGTRHRPWTVIGDYQLPLARMEAATLVSTYRVDRPTANRPPVPASAAHVGKQQPSRDPDDCRLDSTSTRTTARVIDCWSHRKHQGIPTAAARAEVPRPNRCRSRPFPGSRLNSAVNRTRA